jgi:hypothetical protein
MSAQRVQDQDGGLPKSYRVPPAEWEPTSTGGRLTWHPTRDTTKVALFRIVTDDGVATLQHIREIVTSQRHDSYATVDDEAELADVPRALRHVVEGNGLTLAKQAEVDA